MPMKLNAVPRPPKNAWPAPAINHRNTTAPKPAPTPVATASSMGPVVCDSITMQVSLLANVRILLITSGVPHSSLVRKRASSQLSTKMPPTHPKRTHGGARVAAKRGDAAAKLEASKRPDALPLRILPSRRACCQPDHLSRYAEEMRGVMWNTIDCPVDAMFRQPGARDRISRKQS